MEYLNKYLKGKTFLVVTGIGAVLGLVTLLLILLAMFAVITRNISLLFNIMFIVDIVYFNLFISIVILLLFVHRYFFLKDKRPLFLHMLVMSVISIIAALIAVNSISQLQSLTLFSISSGVTSLLVFAATSVIGPIFQIVIFTKVRSSLQDTNFVFDLEVKKNNNAAEITGETVNS